MLDFSDVDNIVFTVCKMTKLRKVCFVEANLHYWKFVLKRVTHICKVSVTKPEKCLVAL